MTGLTPKQRRFLKHALRRLSFGDPVIYRQPAGTLWLVFYDARISFRDVARISVLVANIGLVPSFVAADDTIRKRRALRARAFQILNSHVLPWSSDPDGTETANNAIKAQGTTLAVMRAGNLGNLVPA